MDLPTDDFWSRTVHTHAVRKLIAQTRRLASTFLHHQKYGKSWAVFAFCRLCLFLVACLCDFHCFCHVLLRTWNLLLRSHMDFPCHGRNISTLKRLIWLSKMMEIPTNHSMIIQFPMNHFLRCFKTSIKPGRHVVLCSPTRRSQSPGSYISQACFFCWELVVGHPASRG